MDLLWKILLYIDDYCWDLYNRGPAMPDPPVPPACGPDGCIDTSNLWLPALVFLVLLPLAKWAWKRWRRA